MKSTITQLYDYQQAPIPEKYRLWRIKDEEIRGQLETLSHDCARLEDVEEVQPLDAVRCRGESTVARWSRGNLLFYPGRGLCDEALENACLGKKVGETYTAAVENGEVTLTVERIVRQFIPPVDDELVRVSGPEGVDTVEDYYRWYREQNEPQRRQDAVGNVAYILIREIIKNSTFALDEEEKNAWCRAEAQRNYDLRVASGMDPTIPEEGTTFLTSEEALARLQAKQEPRFAEFVACAYLAEHVGGQNLEEVYRQYLNEFIDEVEIPADAGTDDPVEFMEKESGVTFLQDMAYMGAAIKLLTPYAETKVEA